MADWSNTKIKSNSGNNSFAKICGREWTYYVKRLRVNIGRPPDGGLRSSVGLDEEPSSALDPEDADAVHIDLGPSKLISRTHAELYFDSDDSQWHVVVYGRNGAKHNDTTLRRGQRRIVKSGDILEIAGTQMMFVGAQGPTVIHPSFIEQLRLQNFEHPEIPIIDNEAHAHPQAPAQDNGIANISRRSRPNGQTVIAPAPPDFVRPITPTRSPQKPAKHGSGTKESPAYGRGIVMASNEKIDYRLDSNRDYKPTWSYSSMISQAILSTPDEVLSLDGIYSWIKENFSYYRFVQSNWQVRIRNHVLHFIPRISHILQNSIRHNLSLSTAFKKTPRGPNDPGKGSNWAIVPDKKEELVTALEKQKRRQNTRRSSGPSSPAIRGPSTNTLDSSQPYAQSSNDGLKASPSSRTPPLSSYPITAQESYTPSRGPQLSAYDKQQPLPVLSDNPSPLPTRRAPGRNIVGLGSSPTLTSGSWTNDHHTNPMMTPAPRPYNLNLPLPNTVKPPTSHMQESSPAPFWKFTDQAESTPARWPGETSPLKTNTLQSSSPPPAVLNGAESPTRGRGVLPITNRGVDTDDEEGGFDLARYVIILTHFRFMLKAVIEGFQKSAPTIVNAITPPPVM